MTKDKKFEEKMQRVEQLLIDVENWPEGEAREVTLELIQSIMDFHAAGIEKMMDITSRAGAAGYAIFDDLAKDDLVSNLLMLYGLHPMDVSDRVLTAIEKVRPSLSLHEGDVELLGINDGVVSLRLKGSCDGCPSSALTLKHTIEDAIYAAAPDITSIQVEGSTQPQTNGLVQIEKPIKRTYADCEFAVVA